MALLQKLNGITFTNTTIPKIYRDEVVTKGGIYCYDLADATSWVKQSNSVSGDVIANLVDGGEVATLTSDALTFAGGGFTNFAVAGTQRILLPDAAKLEANTGGFLVAVWIKPGTQTQAAADLVAGYRYVDTGPWGIRYTSPNHKVLVNGEVVSLGTLTSAVHQVVMGWVPVSAGVFEKRVYLDGALFSASASPATLQAPTTLPTKATLGDAYGTTGLNSLWVGSIYRSWMDDLGVSGADPLVLVQKDWAANNGRFS